MLLLNGVYRRQYVHRDKHFIIQDNSDHRETYNPTTAFTAIPAYKSFGSCIYTG